MRYHQSLPVLLTLTLTLPLSLPTQADLGLTCRQHPAASQIRNPVLIRSWQYTTLETSVLVNGRVLYHPRYPALNYTPVHDPTSTRFHALDLFYIGGANTSRTNSANLFFQRPAMVYLFLNAYGYNPDAPQVARLHGWTSEGWAYLGADGHTIPYGVFQHSTFTVSRYVYVFSKAVRQPRLSFFVPHAGWLDLHVRGIRVRGPFHLRIAEGDGTRSPAPSAFQGVQVRPNERCPDVLHESWGTGDDNTEDNYTRGMRFGSWHPQWDPCYWWYVSFFSVFAPFAWLACVARTNESVPWHIPPSLVHDA